MNLDNIKYHLLLGTLKAVAWLPSTVLYGISDVICLVLRRVLHYRKKIIDENLRSSFPDKSEAEIDSIRNEFYRHLSDVMVETIKLLHISDKELDRRIEVVNYQLIDDIAASGTSVILFLAHYCNWEWVPDVSRFYTPQIHSYHVYKPLRSPVSDRLFMRIRSRFNSMGIPQKQVLRKLIGMKHDGELFMCGFISDHRSNSSKSHHYVEFLNHHTPINDVGEALGVRCDCRFVYLDLSKPSRGHYRMEFKEMAPADMSVEMPFTKEYFALLEQSIRRQPPYWLWSHRRWLYK